jgi:hypothetical protein
MPPPGMKPFAFVSLGRSVFVEIAQTLLLLLKQ